MRSAITDRRSDIPDPRSVWGGTCRMSSGVQMPDRTDQWPLMDAFEL